jgi:hypothetical protein
MKPPRITVRRMMIIVAVVAGLLALAVAFDFEWRPDLYGLRIGRRVVIMGPRVLDLSGRALPAGTPAEVVADDRGAEVPDAGSREVVVELSNGDKIKVRRDDLRPVKETW